MKIDLKKTSIYVLYHKCYVYLISSWLCSFHSDLVLMYALFVYNLSYISVLNIYIILDCAIIDSNSKMSPASEMISITNPGQDLVDIMDTTEQ